MAKNDVITVVCNGKQPATWKKSAIAYWMQLPIEVIGLKMGQWQIKRIWWIWFTEYIGFVFRSWPSHFVFISQFPALLIRRLTCWTGTGFWLPKGAQKSYYYRFNTWRRIPDRLGSYFNGYCHSIKGLKIRFHTFLTYFCVDWIMPKKWHFSRLSLLKIYVKCVAK